MKLLENKCYVFRITYFNPYPPDISDFTFHILGNSIEECIQDLCKMRNIKPNFVKETHTICKLESINDDFLDKLITQNLNIYYKRNKQQKQKYDEYIEKVKTKPVNTISHRDEEMVFSVL